MAVSSAATATPASTMERPQARRPAGHPDEVGGGDGQRAADEGEDRQERRRVAAVDDLDGGPEAGAGRHARAGTGPPTGCGRAPGRRPRRTRAWRRRCRPGPPAAPGAATRSPGRWRACSCGSGAAGRGPAASRAPARGHRHRAGAQRDERDGDHEHGRHRHRDPGVPHARPAHVGQQRRRRAGGRAQSRSRRSTRRMRSQLGRHVGEQVHDARSPARRDVVVEAEHPSVLHRGEARPTGPLRRRWPRDWPQQIVSASRM